MSLNDTLGKITQALALNHFVLIIHKQIHGKSSLVSLYYLQIEVQGILHNWRPEVYGIQAICFWYICAIQVAILHDGNCPLFKNSPTCWVVIMGWNGRVIKRCIAHNSVSLTAFPHISCLHPSLSLSLVLPTVIHPCPRQNLAASSSLPLSLYYYLFSSLTTIIVE